MGRTVYYLYTALRDNPLPCRSNVETINNILIYTIKHYASYRAIVSVSSGALSLSLLSLLSVDTKYKHTRTLIQRHSNTPYIVRRACGTDRLAVTGL